MNSPEDPQPEPQRDGFSDVALDCYLAAIQDIAEAVRSISPEIGAACHEQLIRLRARLPFKSNVQTLEETRSALHHELETFAERARRYNNARAQGVTDTLAMLAHNENSLSARNNRFVEQLTEFADRMEQVARSGDLAGFAERAAELRVFVKSMEQDSREALTRLLEKMAEFQNKVREAESLASLDPLTGVANRREFDRQLAARIAADRDFCMLLFDLDQFKAVNDRFGHLCGDQILKQLGARLSGQVRARDFVCRWGGDEFVAILECGLSNAVARSRQITQLLSGPYRVTVEGRDKRIDIRISCGVAERVAGETPEQLFRRVDDSLYRQKSGQTAR